MQVTSEVLKNNQENAKAWNGLCKMYPWVMKNVISCPYFEYTQYLTLNIKRFKKSNLKYIHSSHLPLYKVSIYEKYKDGFISLTTPDQIHPTPKFLFATEPDYSFLLALFPVIYQEQLCTYGFASYFNGDQYNQFLEDNKNEEVVTNQVKGLGFYGN